MKQVLFISHSRLSHNLIRSLVPIIDTKMNLACVDSLMEAISIPKIGRPYHLVLLDFNCLISLGSLKGHLNDLNRHPLLKNASKILIHPHHVKLLKEQLEEMGMHAFYIKPFLTDELAKIIFKWIKPQKDLFIQSDITPPRPLLA